MFNDHTLGFRIMGACRGERRLVDAAAALAAYSVCDARVETGCEAYLSAFWYGPSFREYLKSTGSTKGYEGSCWSPWIWWDIDRQNNVDAARQDAAKLILSLSERYKVCEYNILAFFSGSKGFHVGFPTVFMSLAMPSPTFNLIARDWALGVAQRAGVLIDTGVYDKVRAFRAPNSRHPKTGLYKRRISLDGLMELDMEAIMQLAKSPEPFDIPEPSPDAGSAQIDWDQAALKIGLLLEEHQQRASRYRGQELNQLTMDFIREGAEVGDRHRLLYSAAANLAEFGCPAPLAHALLTNAALDSGLPPKEVKRQIECGLRHACDPGAVVNSAKKRRLEAPSAFGGPAADPATQKSDCEGQLYLYEDNGHETGAPQKEDL